MGERVFFGEEGIGEQELFSLALLHSVQRGQLLRLFSGQPVFFFSKWRRKANDRDSGLDVAGAFDASIMVRGDAHGATGERPKGIDCAIPLGGERGAGQVLELFRQLLGETVGPVVQHR